MVKKNKKSKMMKISKIFSETNSKTKVVLNITMIAIGSFLIVQGALAVFPQVSGIASIFAGVAILLLSGVWSMLK